MAPVTWNDVERLLRSIHPQSLTNREISDRLNADMMDVTCITRLMAKAGTLSLYKPTPSLQTGVNLYRFNEQRKSA